VSTPNPGILKPRPLDANNANANICHSSFRSV
jgi:hypothetical protein